MNLFWLNGETISIESAYRSLFIADSKL